MWGVPEIGSTVWVEFESGEIERPVWVGGLWSTRADENAREERLVIRTRDGVTITLEGARIRVETGAGAIVDLEGPRVSINRGALDVV